jgi:hypothetical protein
MKNKRFASRKGTFIKAMLLAALLMPVTLLLFKTEMMLSKPVAIALIFLPFSLFLWIYMDTSYVIAENKLHYRSGFIRGTVNIDDIKRVIKGRTAWSGIRPATASNGLLIAAEGGYEIYISPDTNEEFVSELLKINEKIIVSV